MPALFHSLWTFLAAKFIAALVLTAFVTCIAYIHNLRLKTLVFSIPVPFTCAYIQSNLHIGNTHILGLMAVTSYHWVVFLVVKRLRLPLLVGIIAGATGYVLLLMFLASSPWMAPLRAASMFGVVCAVAVAAWLVGITLYRPVKEPGHRSQAPWYVKSPLIFVMGLGIYSMTGLLGGGVTTFPYAGVFTSYEMRHSLRTLAGQFMLNIISMLLMFLTIRWLERHGVGLVWRLMAGWSVLGVALACIYRAEVGKPREPVPVGD